MDKLRECPFCGRTPKVLHRTDSLDGYFCAISCFCGGYSARAHQAATGADESEAYMKAALRWNRRATPENKLLTNGDLIRSMGNEELAVTLACPNEMGKAEIDCDHSDDKNCCQCLLDWLNQPCEPEQEAAL